MAKILLMATTVLVGSANIVHSQENYKYLSNPTYYDNEGMRGYASFIIANEHVFFIASVCEYYDPVFAGHRVDMYNEESEQFEFNFKDINGKFIDKEYYYNKIPLEFYKDTCGKNARFLHYMEDSVK